MKKLLLALGLVFFASQSFCQLSLVGGYKTFNPDGWNDEFIALLNHEPYPMAGWQVGLNYWFRLRKRRIEFAPELSYARFQMNFETGILEHAAIGFHFNTDFYVFDLAGDCNCPTFSKDGNFFSKGFFVELSPGVTVVSNQVQSTGTIAENTEGTDVAFGGAVGAGLDLGFSDLFTITPLVRLHYYPDFDWDYDLNPANMQTDLKQLFLGLRFRLHFKEFGNTRFH